MKNNKILELENSLIKEYILNMYESDINRVETIKELIKELAKVYHLKIKEVFKIDKKTALVMFLKNKKGYMSSNIFSVLYYSL